MATVVEHTYRYAVPSALLEGNEASLLRLATSAPTASLNPSLFFQGRFVHPRLAADLLLALVRVVQARYHVPPAMVARLVREADPVVTCGEDRLRLEAFSACCGVYGRVDLLPEGLEGVAVAYGTTNVDFNPDMRTALTRVRAGQNMRLSVGAGHVEVETEAGSVVERKVPLPLRWLKGFTEVQAIQASMRPRLEVSGVEARRFLRDLPRQGTRGGAAWVVPSGRGLRLGQVSQREGVRVAGTERLRLLESLAPHASRLRIHAADQGEASGWELTVPGARFHLVLSAEVWRGFSGEGQVLHALAAELPPAVLEQVRQSLAGERLIAPERVAAAAGLSPREVHTALGRLAATGVLGYDLAEQSYFYRVLPFDLTRVEQLNPRLRDARALLERRGVRLAQRSATGIEAWVQGSGVEHHVRLTEAGATCSCPWYARHHGERGPCKHLLAVQLMLEEQQP